MDNNEMNAGNQNKEQPVVNNATTPQTINNYNCSTSMEEPMSIGSWLVTLLIMCIPCVNIIMLFVWAFSSENKSKQNFFKAYLILIAILIVLQIVLIIIFGASLAALFSSMNAGDFNFNMY